MCNLTLSYIIPIYNGSSTIEHCLDSIYCSGINLSEFEIVVVDDCSSDDTVCIIERYAQSHPNLRIIKHDTNKRQGGAKNTGIKKALGKYIAFADQDDEVVSENLAEMLKIAKEEKSDIISFQWFECKNKEILRRGIKLSEKKYLTGVSFCESLFDITCSLGPWSYLYRLDFLKQLARPMVENILMEDADWIAWHLIHAQTVLCVNIPIYKWIRNAESITSGVSYRHKADWVLFGLRKIEDSLAYHDISVSFATIMYEDGRYNIERTMRKLWKSDNYYKFYERLGNKLIILQRMKWSFRTNYMFRHPKTTCFVLKIIGPVLIRIKKLSCV